MFSPPTNNSTSNHQEILFENSEINASEIISEEEMLVEINQVCCIKFL